MWTLALLQLLSTDDLTRVIDEVKKMKVASEDGKIVHGNGPNGRITTY